MANMNSYLVSTLEEKIGEVKKLEQLIADQSVDLTAKLEKKDGIISNLRKVLKDLSDQAGDDMNSYLVATLEEKNSRLQKLDKINIDLSQKLEEKESEISNLAGQVCTHSRKVEDLEKVLSIKNSDYDEKVSQLETLQKNHESNSLQLQNKNADVSNLRKIMKDLTDQVGDKTKDSQNILSIIEKVTKNTFHINTPNRNDATDVNTTDASSSSLSTDTKHSIRPEMFTPHRLRQEEDAANNGTTNREVVVEPKLANYTTIMAILKKFQVELKENMKDARQLMQHSPKAYIFLLKIESTINFLMDNMRTISQNVEQEFERKDADLKTARDQKRTAQLAVTKYISLLDDAKKFVISQSESAQSERVSELELKVASLQTQLDTRGKVFSDTLLEVERMISKMFNRDFKFNINTLGNEKNKEAAITPESP